MKWEFNKEKINGNNPFVRLYKVDGRPFNFIFHIEDWQGDGCIRTTLILLQHAIQIVIPFDNNKNHFKCRLAVFKNK
jgi:hypothetical protein